MIGIYCIENKVNHMKYIGQSINIRKRWQEHRRDLDNNVHDNRHLQSSWNKHGESYFLFYVLEICDDDTNLTSREKFWVDKLETLDNKHGYNIAIPGEPPMKGKKMSTNSRIKMSRNHANFSGDKHPKSILTESDVKQIIVMFINRINVKDIAKHYSVSISCINHIKCHHNWTYLTDGLTFKRSKHRLAETTISQPYV